ncbi:MAG: hypothetical protein ABI728_04045 [Betaproteobacteria bacterium]
MGKDQPKAGTRSEYYDTKVQGLQIRVTATGVKTFYVYRWVLHELGEVFAPWLSAFEVHAPFLVAPAQAAVIRQAVDTIRALLLDINVIDAPPAQTGRTRGA